MTLKNSKYGFSLYHIVVGIIAIISLIAYQYGNYELDDFNILNISSDTNNGEMQILPINATPIPDAPVEAPIWDDSIINVVNTTSINTAVNTVSNEIDYSQYDKYYDPRVYFEDAIDEYLDLSFRNELSDTFTSRLKGKNILESSWNLLEWESEYLIYNDSKADSIDDYDTYDARIQNEIAWIKSPKQFFTTKDGICSDYAIFTAASLMKMGYLPTLICIETEGDAPDHAVCCIEYADTYYVIDQHFPIYSLYDYLGNYESENGVEIKNIELYQLNGITSDVTYDIINISYTPKIYTYSEYSENKYLEQQYQNGLLKYDSSLTLDSNLEELYNQEYLPRGYDDGVTWTYSIYTSDTVFSEYFYRELIDDADFVSDLKYYDYFWIDVSTKQNDATYIYISLAK